MEENKIQANLSEDIPEWKLRLSYFYTTHKTAFKRGLQFLLFFADIIIVFTFGRMLVDYQTSALQNEYQMKQLPKNLVNAQAISNKKPLELIVSSVEKIARGAGRYDLLVSIENPNTNWAVPEIKYSFNDRGESFGEKSIFLLPAETKYVIEFNAAGARDPQFNIVSSNWQRMRDYSLVSYKNGIKVQKSVFQAGGQKGISGEAKIELLNDTPYGFWEVGLTIVLFNFKSDIIGVNYIALNKFAAKETKLVSALFHDELADRVSRVEAYPEVNLLNPNSIMRLQAENGSPPGLEF